ncbi:MAG: hypothetical protein ACE5GZ_01515 [Gammaproteobacteria bacterium]
MTPFSHEQLLTRLDAREFFQDAVQSALSRQRLSVCDETIVYLVHLLTAFIRAERLYEPATDGPVIKPLALLYADAVQARNTADRDNALRRLGDMALFISGLFADSLSRSLVDVDYYIAMGGTAYACLADSSRISRGSHVLKGVFVELAGRFAAFVDVLAEVAEQANLNNSSDIMRLYEIWVSTGSKHAAGRLQKLGIHPVKTRRLTH